MVSSPITTRSVTAAGRANRSGDSDLDFMEFLSDFDSGPKSASGRRAEEIFPWFCLELTASSHKARFRAKMDQRNESFVEWIQTRQRREREGEMSVGERQPRARQRLECVELAPAFGRRVVVGVVVDVAKAPASRAHSKRFAELGDIWYVAPAFGVRGACSRFWEGQQRSRAMPKRRQAGRSPNASRNSETFGTSRQRLECVELAPAFGRDSSGRGRCQSAGRPDALQTLRGTPRHLARRANVWSAFSLRLNAL